jgi:hypothetical protein
MINYYTFYITLLKIDPITIRQTIKIIYFLLKVD